MRRRTWIATGIVVVAAGGLAAWLVASGGDGTEATAAERTTTTVALERRDLIDRETVDGTLGFADVRAVASGVAGTLTWLPDEGEVVRRGEPLAEFGEVPVPLLYGDVPAHRSLAPGVGPGEDVRQLERNLVALGHGDGDVTVDRSFDADTAEAIRDWQDDLGVDRTGALAQGSFLFLPGPRRVGAHAAAVGSSVAPGAPVYESTSTEPEVTVALDATRRDLVAEGDEVRVTLPDDREVGGRITAVGAVASGDATDPTATPTVEVTIALRGGRATGGFDGAPVDVAITSEVATDALAAPVTSLLALLEGGYAVEVAGADGSTSLVAVEPGLFADGWVELDADLEPGTEVVVPA